MDEHGGFFTGSTGGGDRPDPLDFMIFKAVTEDEDEEVPVEDPFEESEEYFGEICEGYYSDCPDEPEDEDEYGEYEDDG
ncbi:MAG: hypothetical protein GXX89_06735 [Clostridiales bacterium]|jgi:hypothetical protein|nr:hypothetical protein [Clostridiales bacterium]